MKRIVKNYQQPTPPKWRKIGDMALLLAIAIEPSVQSMPLDNLVIKQWLSWSFTTALIIFKFWTNTRIEQNGQ